MKMIVGLGNPGTKYARNRHNVGFMFLDWLGHKVDASDFQIQARFEAEIADVPSEDKTFFVKPQTFMNNSGKAVRSIADFYDIEPTEIILVHDDLDITLGEFKIQQGKGPKVHNGITSVEQHLGTTDFTRVRIGVDNRDGDRTIPGKDYVLQNFSAEEMQSLTPVFEQIYTELWTQ